MPTPARTSLDDIVRAGRDILDTAGSAGLTMQAVATRVGVRAPSLYKRIRSRDELLRLMATTVADDLGDRLGALVGAAPGAAAGSAPGAWRQQLTDLAHAFRGFAHAHPEQYRLLFAPASEATGADPAALARAAAPLLDIAARLAGPTHALEAARTITAWASGFIGMELAGAFRLGGDVDRAYAFGIAALADALTKRR